MREPVGHYPGLRLWTALFFFFLYAPMVVLVAYSFNVNKLAMIWGGFSTRWYVKVVSTSGIGTDDHLLLVMLERATGARFTIVHYNGAPQQRNAMMAAQVQVNMVSIGEYAPTPEGMRYVAHAGAERSRFAPSATSA